MIKTLAYILGNIRKTHRWLVLSKIIKDNKVKSYVEVGVWRGDNIKRLLKLCPGVKLSGVDNYDYLNYRTGQEDKQVQMTAEEWESAKNRTLKLQKSKYYTHLLCNSIKGSEMFDDNSLDMVFIDAEHTYQGVKEDIEAWLPKVKPGGILVGHDYNIRFMGVVFAVNESLGVDEITVKPDIWIYKK